jgi:hypothetical protein
MSSNRTIESFPGYGQKNGAGGEITAGTTQSQKAE